jgi:4-diphosphocytidyl-2-C-methyl-D-erythritol kinase
MRLRELAPGKVNLCLFLGPVREDGRHELVTLFESVSLADELVVEVRPEGGHDEVHCRGVEGPNLVEEALHGLRAAGWTSPPVRVEITKRVPVAAGMGGGSADAAALLRLAPRLGEVDGGAVSVLAAQLGADVPAQLTRGVVLGTGAGEVVGPRAPLAAHGLVVVPLPAELSTPAVYAEADRLGLPRGREELALRLGELERELAPGGKLPASLLVNDLEPAAHSLCVAIAPALDAVRGTAADAALVCGSGPTVAGVFWGEDGERRARGAAESLAPRFPGATAVVPTASTACGTI